MLTALTSCKKCVRDSTDLPDLIADAEALKEKQKACKKEYVNSSYFFFANANSFYLFFVDGNRFSIYGMRELIRVVEDLLLHPDMFYHHKLLYLLYSPSSSRIRAEKTNPPCSQSRM